MENYCGDCIGTGEILSLMEDDIIDCPACDGTGVIEVDDEKEENHG